LASRLHRSLPVPLATRDPFPGSSAMADLMRRKDWTATALGDPDDWPETLRTAVGICLESRFPIVLWWGPRLALLYNDAYLPMLGVKHPASLGQAGEAAWSEIWPTIGPMLDGVMSRGQATWSDDLPLFIDRRGFMEECYFTFSYSPIRADDGTVGGVFSAVNETTARVRAERRLALFRDLSSIVTDDPADAARRAVERLKAAADDITSVRLAPHDDPGAVFSATGSAGEDGTTTVLALRDEAVGADDLLILGRNPAIPMDRQYAEFFDLVGSHVAKVLATARAQAAERHRADALAALDRAKTVFFTNVSHEFRTPLTLIDAPLRELADDPGLAPADMDRVSLALRASSRLRRLVNTLLEFSRIESGTSTPRTTSLDLGEIARDVASVFRSAFESAGLSLRVTGEGPSRPVLADAAMLERILLNLVSNALKFTAEGGVDLRLEQDGDEAVVSVVDTGIGIAEADLERVFDRFARVESGWSRSSEGSGIGLALAAELARLQGGTLTVTSEPGAGSTFTLRLPLGSGATTAKQPPAQERQAFADEASGWLVVSDASLAGAHEGDAPRGKPGRPRILIADDNADMRTYLERILGRHWTVESVGDGAAALARIDADPPDLVLADVMMPGIDGLELVGRIRERPGLGALPVVLLSARAGEEARAEGLAGGADEYLVKPFTATDLVARISSHLGRQEARRAGGDELRASEARWRTLIEANPNPIVMTDASGGITYFNPAWLRFLGVDAPGPLGSAWGDVVHPEDLPRLVEDWNGAVASGSVLLTEVRVRRGDGAYRWMTLHASPVTDGSGAPTAWVSVATDVDDQRRSTEAREAFVGVLAHELRTPITSIYAASVLLNRTAGGDVEAIRSLAGDLGSEADRLRRMVDDLVVISHVERGASLVRDEPMLVQRVVDRVVREEANRYPERQIDLVLESDLPPVAGDDGYLEQILRNLLSNAWKYAGTAPVTVETRLGPCTGQVSLAVRDRGPGFLDGDEDRVFDLFYRGDAASRRAAGSGIGLYVVRALATAMGGTVGARTHPDGGAEVIVTLRTVG
jgi:PAS domain S-box-containing protein